MLDRSEHYPSASRTAESASLVPKKVPDWQGEVSPEAISHRLDDIFKGRTIAPVKSSQLREALGINVPQGSKFSAVICHLVGEVLDKIDIGFEPDGRYGPSVLFSDSDVILFKSTGGGPVEREKPTYKSALTMIEVTILAAAADGNVADEEVEVIIAELKAALDLSDVERVRLLAFAWVAVRNLPRQQAVMGRLAKLPEQDRRHVAQSAILAVLADGSVLTAEIRFVENLYRVFGYPIDDLREALERGVGVIGEPVVLATEQRVEAIIIPRSNPGMNKLNIDAARLERIKKETADVSTLLATVFAEDTPSSPVPIQGRHSDQAIHGFSGLDVAHAELLAAVLAVNVIARDNFERRARSLRLLPDGAFETINEWGFENFEEAVLEGEEMIAVANELRAKLERLGSAT